MKTPKILVLLVAPMVFPALAQSNNVSGVSPLFNTKPNIILIVSDDQGYSDLGIAKRAWDVVTPQLDRLAQSGIRFEQAYSTASICSPSRCALINGVYQQRQGNYGNRGPGIHNEQFPTLAEKLKSVGYTTGYVGKSHYGEGEPRSVPVQNGVQEPNRMQPDFGTKDLSDRNFPNNHGFDYFYGFTHSRKHYLKHQDVLEVAEQAKIKASGNYGVSMRPSGMWENKERVDAEGFSTEIFSEKTRDFMRRNKDRPFFVQLSFNAVHTFTHQLPEEYLRQKGLKGYHDWDPETEDYYSWNIGSKHPYNPEGRALYLGQLHYIDREVGKILDFLEAEGLRENTVVLYISDNGGSPAIYANNDPLREGKFSLYEGGIRVPFIASWPGHFTKGEVLYNVVSLLDIFPTVNSLAGVDYGNTDGIDLTPLLTGQNRDLGHEVLVWDEGVETAVRKGKWKLKTATDLRRAQRHLVDLKYGEFLYNLEEDAGETRDLRYVFPDKFEELKETYRLWKEGIIESQANSES